jgi:hypothetical protein
MEERIFMTKISFIGDSIRMQYAPRVIDRLGEGYEVYQPQENCRFAKYSLRGMWDWKAGMSGSRIVHWNNGLWDMCDLFDDGMFTSVEEYVSTMLRIADILLSRHEIIIFATTTPVRKENPHNSTDEIKRYNDALVPLLKEKGIIINDLFSLVAQDIPRYVSDDLIHLSEEGIELCAEAVTKAIIDAEKMLKADKGDCASDNEKDTSGAPILFNK